MSVAHVDIGMHTTIIRSGEISHRDLDSEQLTRNCSCDTWGREAETSLYREWDRTE